MSNEPAPGLHLAEPENDPEKPRVEVHDEIVSLGHLSSDSDIPARQIMNSPDEGINEKKLLHKIDYALIPWLGILYLLSFLDRSSIGNAKLYGMEADLRISDTQYLICLSVFFIPYALLEVPANICLKRLKPSIWLSSIMLLWGITMTLQGLIHNFGGLFAVRWMLGVFEAGLWPGSIFVMSNFYKRNEFGIRIAIFNSAVTFSGAFSGLLAAAISNMDGVGGKPAWAWIFILQGLITVIAGVASFFLIQDYPESARFLSERERLYIVQRLQQDNQSSAAEEQFAWRNVRKSFMDGKTWLGAICLIGTDNPLYSFSLFLPSIISQLGFTATRANLLTVPVYFVACIFACVIGYLADRTKRRGQFAIALSIITATGYIILIFSRNPALSYFATFVAGIGIFPAIPNIAVWISNNTEGPFKRGISVALACTCGNLTGAISSNVYRSRDIPWYTLGHGITLAFVIIGLIGCVSLHFLLRRENERRDRGERDEVIGSPEKSSGNLRNGQYDSIEAAKKDKGDEWSGFRYIT